MKKYTYPGNAGTTTELSALTAGTTINVVDASSSDSASFDVTLGEDFRAVNYDDVTTHEAWGRTSNGDLMLVVLENGDADGQSQIACDSTGTSEMNAEQCQEQLDALTFPEAAATEEAAEETPAAEESPAEEPAAEEVAEESAEEVTEEKTEEPAAEEASEEKVEESTDETPAAESKEEAPAEEKKEEAPAAKKEKKESGPSREDQIRALLAKDPNMKCSEVNKELGMNYSYCNRLYKKIKAESPAAQPAAKTEE